MKILIDKELRTDEQGQYYYTEYDKQFSDGTPYSKTERIVDLPFDIHKSIELKILEINQLADTELSQGFESSALGEEYHYYNHDKFPQWYRDKATVQQTSSRSDTVSWLTLKDGISEMKDHTAEQFDQVFADLIAFEQPIEYKRLSLLEQAKGCETQEDLDNITW